MKIAAIGLLALSGMLWAAPDLNDTFNSLKTATEAKDAEKVKMLAPEAAKEAKEILSKSDNPADVMEFAKGAAEYSEYALSVVAAGSSDAQTTIDLTDLLLAQNNKSKHVDTAAAAYLAALAKQSPAKATAGAVKILAGRPDNEDALYWAASGNSANPGVSGGYAAKLVSVMRSKAKPEGVSEADWDKKKSAMLGAGYYLSGVAAGQQRSWVAADRDLKAAIPLISGNAAMLGPAYFFLGLSNYQLGKLTQDRARMQAGIKYTEQAAGVAGSMQGQAANNLAAMKREMAGPPAGRR